ncbi:hypothetical protein G0U57_004511, partial [Chelydra serpentina]
EPQTCRFYDQLHAILGQDPTSTPTLSVDICKVAALRNTDEDFVDEEEENAQQASGESILPGSQDLFLTLEPILSQGILFPDLEGGEGSSGEDAVALPRAHLQQRTVEKELRGSDHAHTKRDSNVRPN